MDKSVENYSAGVKLPPDMNTPEENKQFRQGDILIESVAAIPDVAQREETSRQVTLAYGERTGHKHILETEDPADWWNLGEANRRPMSGLEASDIYFSVSEAEPSSIRSMRRFNCRQGFTG